MEPKFPLYGTVDYSKKTLVVALSLDETTHNGMIFNPSLCPGWAPEHVAITSMQEFYTKQPNQVKVSIKTEMGPGELVKRLEKDYGASWHMIDGGVSANFSIPQSKITSVLEDLIENPGKFEESKEKKVFVPTP